MTIKEWLNQCRINQLDAQLILSHVLNKSKEWILAHDDILLPTLKLREINNMQKRRIANEPMAYLLGSKEFFRRNFVVSPNVLIPRPETENLVELVIDKIGDKNAQILDVGTGSGCVAITLDLELPNSEVTAVDISQKALKTARKNAKNLKSKIRLQKSDLLSNIAKKQKFNLIIANLPYVDRSWQTGAEIEFEPDIALFAPENGLKLIKRLISESPAFLLQKGYLALEADQRQHVEIIEFAKKHGYSLAKINGLAILLKQQ